MSMNVTFITIFPQIIVNFCAESLLGRAQSNSKLLVSTINPRDFSDPPHNKVDDIPYGGGAGMVMMAQPLIKAIKHARSLVERAHVVLLSPCGVPFTQAKARTLLTKNLVLVCGRYEGIDQRVIDNEIDEEISIGDFVLMGGEAAALCVLEATARLIPGVLGNQDSTQEESFDSSGLLEAPSYTRPATLPQGTVPDVLVSGDHQKIAEWKRTERLARSVQRRSDLVRPAGKM